MNRFVHFPSECFNLKKDCLPSYFGQAKVFLHQIMFIPVFLRVIKKCRTTEEGNCKESKKQPLWGSLWGQGWYNIMKVSRPFPLLSFDWYYLIHVWSFSCFMDQASWNSWNLLSFIGQVMISGIQFENHMPEELPTLNMEYSTLNEENKGLYFLDLREEGMALRFRSMTNDQWFLQKAYLLKPEQCISIWVSGWSIPLWGAVLTGEWRLHTLPLPPGPTPLLHFTVMFNVYSSGNSR